MRPPRAFETIDGILISRLIQLRLRFDGTLEPANPRRIYARGEQMVELLRLRLAEDSSVEEGASRWELGLQPLSENGDPVGELYWHRPKLPITSTLRDQTARWLRRRERASR